MSPPRRRVPGIKGGQIAGKPGRVLPHLEHFDPAPPLRLDAAEDRQPAIGPRRRQRRLLPTRCQTRLRYGLVSRWVSSS